MDAAHEQTPTQGMSALLADTLRQQRRDVETRPLPWIQALRHSHETLSSLVLDLDVEQLQGPSYCSGWSIAQVLAHLGSQAEIFGLFLDAGLGGTEPPGREAFAPIWEAWNARSPQAQVDEALEANDAVIERFESLDDDARTRLHLELFGMALDTTGLLRMRLGEHAVHTWDIAVALDPGSTVANDAVDLLVDTLDELAARVGKPDGTTQDVRIATSNPQRHFCLEIGDSIALHASERDDRPPTLAIRAEGLLRLVYGRLDPANTPPIAVDGIDIAALRRIFPGM